MIWPYRDIERFDGTIYTHGHHTINLDVSQLLHKGTVLKNTGRVMALVAYTGIDTKLSLNLSKRPPRKRSRLEYYYNWANVMNLVLMVSLCSILSILNYNFTISHSNHQYVLKGMLSAGRMALTSFLSASLIFNRLIPFDLTIAIEAAKSLSTYRMQQDVQMMRVDKQAKDIQRLKCNTINLHEELGEVEYIFCDKTGTLTQNELVYNSISIVDDDGDGGTRTFITKDKNGQKLKDELEQFRRDENYEHFFNCINLCQDCMAIDKRQSFAYQGQSLDEICLLEMTHDISSLGFFSGKEGEIMTIRFPGQKEAKYKLLRFDEFTSKRKCVSVVVKRIQDDRFFAYVKGADSSLIKMSNPEVHVSDQLKKDVEYFSNQGLRTMVFGYKELFIDLEQKKFLREVFMEDYDIAEFKDRQITEIESDLTLLGATGLEDLLQENVKRCIEDFRAADIKVWMLTGDKGLTAM